MADADTTLTPVGAVYRTRVGREATEPMREDIRLLGAMLGDTVREQNGGAVFDLVERARVESFRVRRSEIDRTELADMFVGIDIHLAIPVIRAFSHFALLANVAEDIHRERRREVHAAAGEPPPDSTLAATYRKLDAARLDEEAVSRALRGALVSPVITGPYSTGQALSDMKSCTVSSPALILPAAALTVSCISCVSRAALLSSSA